MRILLVLASAGLLTETAAQAVTISVGGATDPTGLGTVTRFVDSTGASYARDTETFTGVGPTGQPACTPTSTVYAITDANSGSAGLTGFADYNADSKVGVRLQPSSGPAVGSGCYMSVNAEGNMTGDANITIGGLPLTYVGFVWGSPDVYNYLQFTDAMGNVITPAVNGLTPRVAGRITGDDIYHNFGGFTQDPGNAGSQFVNFQFAPGDGVYGVNIGSDNYAFELDNFVAETDTARDPGAVAGTLASRRAANRFAVTVAEPATGFAFGAALGLLGLARRRRKL